MIETLDTPRLIADEQLRALRAEGNLSWDDFNNLLAIICNFVTALPGHVLPDGSRASEIEQDTEIEVIEDVLAIGLFGPRTRGRWTYEPAAGKEGSITAHVAEALTDQVPEAGFQVSVETNNVHGWLMFGNPDMDEYHVPALEVARSEVTWTDTLTSETCSCSNETVIPETVCGLEDSPTIHDP